MKNISSQLLFISGFILITFLLFQSSTYAQSGNTTLSGKVIDENKEAVPYATVALYSAQDSSLVEGAATGMDGTFELQVSPGRYYLEITFLSYEKKTISDLNLSAGPRDMGSITMREGALQLEEAIVETERSQMELKLDKRVFTVGQDLSNTGGNAAEILDNVPSVSVDVEGNLSLRGSGNVQILIDGKPSGLVGMDPSEALRQIPGNLIDRVEVITNPSARYQAEGEVGIINIILKKEENKGLNGTITATAGYPENFGGSFNINFRREKINWFAQYGTNYRSRPGSGSTSYSFTSPDTTYSYDQIEEHTRSELSHNFRAGADIFLKNKNTLTLSGLYQISGGTNTSINRYKDYDQDGDLIDEVVRDQEEQEDENTIEGSVTHVKNYEREGHKWETTVNFYREEDTEDADLTQTMGDNDDGPLLQHTYNEEDEQNFLLQSDYVHPFGEESKFETGIRITDRIINNNYSVSIQEDGQNFNVIDSLNNDFLYRETIYAAYAIYGSKVNKFSYQLGLRYEYSDIGTELKKQDEKNYRDYDNLFPSLHLGYELTEVHSLQLTYSRRLSRPHFRSLLPFSNFDDNRNFRRGNPDLNPEYTDSYEAGYLMFTEKGSFLTSFYYRHRTGVIDRILVPDADGNNTRIPVNLATQDAYGLEFNISYRPTKWWNLNTDFNFYRAITTGEYQGQSLNADTYTWYSRLTSKFKINKTTDLQLSGRYRAPRNTTQGRTRALYMMDVSAAKDVMQGKGTIALSVRDVFNSRRWRSVTEGQVDDGYFHRDSEFQWRARQFLVTFTYRINQQKSRKPSGGGPDGGEMEGGDEM